MRPVRPHQFLAALLLLAGCRDAPPAAAHPRTLATHPQAMARLARLMREEFSAADPVPVERAIRCESRRVELALGPDYRVRLRWLTDSLRTEFPSEAFDQLGLRLSKTALPAPDATSCRSLDAEAEGEAPLRVPSPTPAGG